MKKSDGKTPSSGTTVACPNCAGMALAQQKLSAQVMQLRNKLDRLLLAIDEIFDDGDGLDWRERNQQKG